MALQIILLLIIVIAIVIPMAQVIGLVVRFFFGDFINSHLLFHSLREEYKNHLLTSLNYYRLLDEPNKGLFERRVQKFINMKSFIARGDLKEVTPEMKALIAGSAIQITFGFPSIYFEHFKRILIYPTDYYSLITRKFHQGEVNPNGLIILSWKNLKEGYTPHTEYNLGLHEMAHALRIENAIENEEYDFLDFSMLRKFTRISLAEMERIRNGEKTIFRPYASTNNQEFFAVAVENFFERPGLFKGYNTELYQTMASLLLQDPLQTASPRILA